VDDARLVGDRQALGDLRADVQDLIDGQPGRLPAQDPPQVLAIHELKHHEQLPVMLARVEDRGDRGMVQPCGRPALPLEPG